VSRRCYHLLLSSFTGCAFIYFYDSLVAGPVSISEILATTYLDSILSRSSPPRAGQYYPGHFGISPRTLSAAVLKSQFAVSLAFTRFHLLCRHQPRAVQRRINFLAHSPSPSNLQAGSHLDLQQQPHNLLATPLKLRVHAAYSRLASRLLVSPSGPDGPIATMRVSLEQQQCLRGTVFLELIN
jgi:hypothetical protein